MRTTIGLALLGWVACGDGGGSITDAGTDAGGATFSGTVTYDGTDTGLLTVGLFRSTPPNGPPLWAFTAGEPTFPIEYSISGISPGTYFVGAILDIGADNPTIPGTEDPTAFPRDPQTVTVGGSYEVDLMLVDPD